MFGFRKNETPIINNTNNIKCEIDYEKLANAIVEAQKRSKEKDLIELKNGDNNNKNDSGKTTDNTKKEKKSLFKSIWSILRNKVDTDDEMTIGTFSFLLEMFFRFVAGFGSILIILLTGTHIVKLSVSDYACWEKVIYSIVTVVLGFMALLFCVLIWGTSNEISREKDKNYLMTIFSSVTGLIAVIISIMPESIVAKLFEFFRMLVLQMIG